MIKIYTRLLSNKAQNIQTLQKGQQVLFGELLLPIFQWGSICMKYKLKFSVSSINVHSSKMQTFHHISVHKHCETHWLGKHWYKADSAAGEMGCVSGRTCNYFYCLGWVVVCVLGQLGSASVKSSFHGSSSVSSLLLICNWSLTNWTQASIWGALLCK